jgi:uncharacterized protein (TIGR02246 family)
MPARNPEDVDRLFGEALNAGNVDALVALYEPGASLTPSPGQRVNGHAAIRDALAQFIGARARMSIVPKVLAQAGDVALVSARWEVSMTGPDGKPAQLSGQSVEVLRRQANGDWLFAIDEPFGIAPSPA